MPNRPRLIAIASGKGGVGKTWVAITLAHALAARRDAVLLFDGDLGLANVDVQLGLSPRHDLAAVLARRVPLTEAVMRHPEGGFDILAGSSGSGSLSGLDPASVEQILALLRDASAYDTVLLDLGAGLERGVRRMAAAADMLLTVATEEPTSLTDAYAVLKLYAGDTRTGDAPTGNAPIGDARILVNQAATHAAGRRTYETLRRACTSFLRLDPPLAGIVRRDDRVRDAIRRQALLLVRHPTCQAAMDVEAIADGLSQTVAA